MADDALTALARKARELTEGMRKRTGRDPDVADYRAAFLPILLGCFAPDALAKPASANVTCQHPNCGKPAVFVRFGRALCFEHRNEVHDGAASIQEHPGS